MTQKPFLLLLATIFMISCSATKKSSTMHSVSFAGTKWVLSTLTGTTIPATAREAYIEFDSAKNAAAGSSGCNRMMGKYTLEGAQLKLGAMAGTRMACPPEVMQFERAFLQALQDTDQFRMEGDQLTLYKEDQTLAVFKAAAKAKP